MSAMPPLPEPEVLIKRVKDKHHAPHHGGAWKVAYADFVTAMMAFFMLMWLLGTVDQDKRKGIADYFAPVVLESQKSGGSTGLLGGETAVVPEGAAPQVARTGITPVRPYQSGQPEKSPAEQANQAREIERKIREKLQKDPSLAPLQGHIKFVHTPEGLRIDLIDQEDYSMFASGTTQMDVRAQELLRVVADVIKPLPQKLSIRGHTDSRPFAAGDKGSLNNWTLSSARAEGTRQQLANAGIPNTRFARLEGVADTQPHITQDPFDPRNRRMSVTLLND